MLDLICRCGLYHLLTFLMLAISNDCMKGKCSVTVWTESNKNSGSKYSIMFFLTDATYREQESTSSHKSLMKRHLTHLSFQYSTHTLLHTCCHTTHMFACCYGAATTAAAQIAFQKPHFHPIIHLYTLRVHLPLGGKLVSSLPTPCFVRSMFH